MLDRLGVRMCAADLCVAAFATGLVLFYIPSDSQIFLWTIYPLPTLLGYLGLYVSDTWIGSARFSVPLTMLVAYVLGWTISWKSRRLHLETFTGDELRQG